jgi:hypothetical protein
MVYFVQGEKTGLIKIGKSSNFTRRLANLRNGGPDRLTCLAVIVRAYDDTVYHDRFSNDRVHGEWFKPSEKLMNFINALPTTKYTGMTHGSRSKRFDDAELQDQFSIVRPEPSVEVLLPLLDLFMPEHGLTPKQKTCILTYFETRDPDAAIQSAYDCQDSSTAERLKYDIFSRWSVLRALSLLLGSNDPGVAKFIQHAEQNERISREQVLELKGESQTEAASQIAVGPATA